MFSYPWQDKIKPLFAKVKLPGWLIVLYAILREIADLYGDITFWFDIVKGMGGYIGGIASILESSWASLILFILGVLYVLCVGESRRVLRHPVWPFLGWTVATLVFLTSWSVLVAGYVMDRFPQQQPWQIVKEEEFIQALRVVGPVTIGLEYIEDRDALFLYGQLYKLFTVSKWTADKRAQVSGSPWVGVHVVIKDKNNIPSGAIELVKQLRANNIASGLVLESNPAVFEKVAFTVRIGYRPPNNNK